MPKTATVDLMDRNPNAVDQNAGDTQKKQAKRRQQASRILSKATLNRELARRRITKKADVVVVVDGTAAMPRHRAVTINHGTTTPEANPRRIPVIKLTRDHKLAETVVRAHLPSLKTQNQLDVLRDRADEIESVS